MSRLDDTLDDRQPFDAITVEQVLIPSPAQEKIHFPDEVPNIVQPRIHPLPSKWAMNVGGITGDEDASNAELRDVPVMDAKIAAPVKRARLNIAWRALGEYF